MFGDLDWPINASRRFVSDSWVSYFSREVTTALLINSGNNPVEKEAFARWAIITENSAWHCFRSRIGIMSSGEVITGKFWISLSTSSGSISSKLDSTDGDDGGGQDIAATADFKCATATAFVDSTFSAKKEESRVANVCVSCPSNHWRCSPGWSSDLTVRHSSLGLSCWYWSLSRV